VRSRSKNTIALIIAPKIYKVLFETKIYHLIRPQSHHFEQQGSKAESELQPYPLLFPEVKNSTASLVCSSENTLSTTDFIFPCTKRAESFSRSSLFSDCISQTKDSFTKLEMKLAPKFQPIPLDPCLEAAPTITRVPPDANNFLVSFRESEKTVDVILIAIEQQMRRI
jgi:hypothetical protein